MEGKANVEALIAKFQFGRLLNQDQNGRRITLLGSIESQAALLTAERAAFPSSTETIQAFLASISSVENIGANDIYHWYLASTQPSSSETSSSPLPSLKLNLIYPCTQKHISKYSSQTLRMVTETPSIYRDYVLPLMQRDRSSGRLDWIFNIIEGRKEQEDIIVRAHNTRTGALTEIDQEGFLLLPDLNWDRKTMSGLHLLALVERRDIWSLRDLRKKHVGWLRTMRDKLLDATVKVYCEQGVERDMLKLYVHYQPTYYHFHIHIVHVMLEASGHTQSTGKAFGLENLISQLEMMTDPSPSLPYVSDFPSRGDRTLPPMTTGGSGDQTIIQDDSGISASAQGQGVEHDAGMQNVELTYFLGEESDLWKEVFGPLKRGDLKAT